MFTEALKVMGIGVGVVFVMLAVFYLMIRVLMRIFPPGTTAILKNSRPDHNEVKRRGA